MLSRRLDALMLAIRALERIAREDCAASLPLLAYRDALREWWQFTADGESSNPAECVRQLERVARLASALGYPLAAMLRRRSAREWWRETGCCPTCSELGPLHEGHPPPEPGSTETI
jgi:hypothetical protein